MNSSNPNSNTNPVDIPTLETNRLILRPLTLADAPHIQRLAGAREVAAGTLSIPHPYEDGMAEDWIAGHAAAFAATTGLTLAVVVRGETTPCGVVGLGINSTHAHAELGYWIGAPYWGRGYCTEAAAGVVDYAFSVLGLNRIYASHFGDNPASGRVMEKLGMAYEGRSRAHVRKGDQFEDLLDYGILRSDWDERRQLAARLEETMTDTPERAAGESGRVKVFADEIIMALTSSSEAQFDYFLDAQTGEVLWVPNEFCGQEEEREEMWEMIDSDMDRYEQIERLPSYRSYNIMAEFIETLPSGRTQDKLARAIAGKGAFRRFKDTLYDFPDVQKAWYKYEGQAQLQLAREWVEQNDIDVEVVVRVPQ